MQLLRCDGDSARLCRGYVKEREHIKTSRLVALAADTAHDTTMEQPVTASGFPEGTPASGRRSCVHDGELLQGKPWRKREKLVAAGACGIFPRVRILGAVPST